MEDAAGAAEVDPASYTIVAMEGEEPAVVEEATLVAKELAKCDRLRAMAISLNVPFAARQALSRKTSILRKQRPSVSKEQLKAQLVLRRHLRAKAEAEQDGLRKKRDMVREAKANTLKRKAKELDSKSAKFLAEDTKKALKKALCAIPRKYNAQDCGHGLEKGGTAKHQTARQNFLERLKLRSPKLPDDLEGDNYARQVAIKHGRATGEFLVTEVNNTVIALGKFFNPP